MSAANCILTLEGTVTTVPVHQTVSVQYTFDTTTKQDLRLPFAVAVDGAVIKAYADKPGALSENRTIEIKVTPGCKVSLYLNSDAYPRFRQFPVYEVMAGRDDISVRIVERPGCQRDVDATLSQEPCTAGTNHERRTVKYRGQLTGDIWMKISHRYTSQEAEEFLPQDVLPEVRAAVLSIYRASGLTTPSLDIGFPETRGLARHQLQINFDAFIDQNARQNICYCPLLSEVLPRVHPRAFCILIAEAYASRITRLTINSSWRPMHGSIAHRLGLGLDINYISTQDSNLHINLASLSDSSPAAKANLNQSEKDKYRAYRGKLKESKDLHRVLENVRRMKVKSKNPDARKMLESEIIDLSNKVNQSDQDVGQLSDEWEAEHKKGEPKLLLNFRQALLKNADVAQVLDPWYIETNTGDAIPPTANAQISRLQVAHNNHLHISVHERHLL